MSNRPATRPRTPRRTSSATDPPLHVPERRGTPGSPRRSALPQRPTIRFREAEGPDPAGPAADRRGRHRRAARSYFFDWPSGCTSPFPRPSDQRNFSWIRRSALAVRSSSIYLCPTYHHPIRERTLRCSRCFAGSPLLAPSSRSSAVRWATRCCTRQEVSYPIPTTAPKQASSSEGSGGNRAAPSGEPALNPGFQSRWKPPRAIGPRPMGQSEGERRQWCRLAGPPVRPAAGDSARPAPPRRRTIPLGSTRSPPDAADRTDPDRSAADQAEVERIAAEEQSAADQSSAEEAIRRSRLIMTAK